MSAEQKHCAQELELDVITRQPRPSGCARAENDQSSEETRTVGCRQVSDQVRASPSPRFRVVMDE